MGSSCVFPVFSPLDSLTLRSAEGYSGTGARLPRRGVDQSRGPLLQSRRSRPESAIATDDPQHRASPHQVQEELAAAPRGATRWLALALATAGGAGFAPVAPGTFGAAVGVLLFLALADLGAAAVMIAVAVLGAIGIWASGLAERAFGRRDDGRIVIDEVVGQLLALAPLPVLAGPGRMRAPVLVLAGFVAFRLFDIWKPGPVGLAERRFHGGVGVMLDDVVAGALAAAAVATLCVTLGGGVA